jgi:hypothetical protein
MRLASKILFLLSALFLFGVGAKGQPQKGQSPSSTSSQTPSTSSTPSATPSAPSGTSLQGLSFTRASWDTELIWKSPETLGVKVADVVVVCYKLVAGNSTTQPFLLEPRTTLSFDAAPTPHPVAKASPPNSRC